MLECLSVMSYALVIVMTLGGTQDRPGSFVNKHVTHQRQFVILRFPAGGKFAITAHVEILVLFFQKLHRWSEGHPWLKCVARHLMIWDICQQTIAPPLDICHMSPDPGGEICHSVFQNGKFPCVSPGSPQSVITMTSGLGAVYCFYCRANYVVMVANIMTKFS